MIKTKMSFWIVISLLVITAVISAFFASELILLYSNYSTANTFLSRDQTLAILITLIVLFVVSVFVLATICFRIYPKISQP